MTQRSSGPDGPDDWGTDGYARGQYYGSAAGGFFVSAKGDGYDAGAGNGYQTGAGYEARNAGAYGAGHAGAYAAGTYEAGTAGTAGGYDAGTAGGYDAGTAGGYGATAAGTAGTGFAGTGFAGTGTEVPTATLPAAPRRPAAADGKGFLGALFDFGFTSLVTPKVIKVLYVLIMIGTVVSALAFTITMFKVSATLGILTLVFGAPLFVLIVLAIYRVILEFFMVAFRIADDVRALRDGGDLR